MRSASALAICFQIGYFVGEVLTEVFGNAQGRRAIRAGFYSMILATVMACLVVNMVLSQA